MNKIVAIRGGGDIASGIAHRLFMSGFKIVILEISNPTVIRRTVSFANAIFEGEMTVEGVTAKKADSMDDVKTILSSRQIPVIVDPDAEYIGKLQAHALIDSILAKRNTGTKPSLAPIVIGVGPGFTAPKDVHAVIESCRGHDLGRVIYSGKALDDTRIPGDIMGFKEERLLKASKDGIIRNHKQIGDIVKAGDVISTIDDSIVRANIDGVLRGLIRENTIVNKNMKIGDVDPRGIISHCYTISDKARAIGGAALEALLYLENSFISKEGI